jgi:16S rRNA (adenine1518-N6/adenine1519-N6)-dimethyltransferase
MTHYAFLAKKKFGQHFLADNNMLNGIVAAIHPQADDQLIEIGPGPGILTDQLLPSVGKLQLIEIDNDWAGYLQERYADKPCVSLHHGDVLQFDWQTLANEKQWRLVGNLPYNISTPLLFHIFAQLDLFRDMHFVLQNEVVNRLVAPVDSKNYGRLSVMAQYYCQAQSLLFIPPESFDPPPKVDSALIRLIPRTEKSVVANDVKQLTDVVREAFSFRRKALSNALKTYFTAAQLEQLGVNPKLRPQNVTVDQYVTLANALDS